jgi:hypothetical protein
MADEETLRPIREALERARERLDYAIGRLKSFEEVRCLRWRCIDCGYVKRFTKPMPAEAAPPCRNVEATSSRHWDEPA